MKSTAEEYLNTSVKNAVVPKPVSFNNSQQQIIVVSHAFYSPIIQTGYFRNRHGLVHKVYWYQPIRLYSIKNNEKIGDQKQDGSNGNPKFEKSTAQNEDGGVTYSFKELFKELFTNNDKTLVDLKQSISNLEGKMPNLKEEVQKEIQSLRMQMAHEHYRLRNQMNYVVALLSVAGFAFLYVSTNIFSISIKENIYHKKESKDD